MSEGEIIETTGKVVEEGAKALEKGMEVAGDVAEVGSEAVDAASQAADVSIDVVGGVGEGIGKMSGEMSDVSEMGVESRAIVPIGEVERLRQLAETDPNKAIVEVAEMGIAKLDTREVVKPDEGVNWQGKGVEGEENVIDVEWREIIENESVEVNDKVDFVMQRASEHWGKRLIEELLLLLIDTEDEEVKKKGEYVREMRAKDQDLDFRTLLIVTLDELPSMAVAEYFVRVKQEMLRETGVSAQEESGKLAVDNASGDAREVSDGGVKALSEGEASHEPLASLPDYAPVESVSGVER